MQGGADSTEARILAIALRHVRRDGFKRTTIVRIAEDAGMTHANIYRYFPSKTALGERLVTDWLRGLEQRLNDITQAPDPADDKLERFATLLARGYAEKAATDPEVFEIFVASAEANDPFASRHRQRSRELLRRIFDEGIATRVFLGGDPRRLERLALDVLHRFFDPHSVRRSARHKDGLNPATMDSRRDRVIRVLLRGISQNRG